MKKIISFFVMFSFCLCSFAVAGDSFDDIVKWYREDHRSNSRSCDEFGHCVTEGEIRNIYTSISPKLAEVNASLAKKGVIKQYIVYDKLAAAFEKIAENGGYKKSDKKVAIAIFLAYYFDTLQGRVLYEKSALELEGDLPVAGEKYMGYVTNIYEKKGIYYMDIDYIDIVSGDQAKKAYEVCTSSFPKNKEDKCGSYSEMYGWYITNTNKKIRTFAIAHDVVVSLGYTHSCRPFCYKINPYTGDEHNRPYYDSPYVIFIDKNGFIQGIREIVLTS